MRSLLLAAALLLLSAGAAAAKEIRLTARDDGSYRFEDADGRANPTLSATAGEPLVVRLENRGATGHNWQLAGAAIPFPVAPGDNATVELTAPGAGEHRYVCLAHEAQGMAGALRVEDAATPAAPALALAVAALVAALLRRAATER